MLLWKEKQVNYPKMKSTSKKSANHVTYWSTVSIKKQISGEEFFVF